MAIEQERVSRRLLGNKKGIEESGLMPDKERPYQIIQHEITNIGRFQVVCDTIKIDGRKYPYSYLANNSSVLLLPIYAGEIVYIHQYRHSFNEWFDELPAGGVDEGESPEKAATRELLEETGLSGKLVKLCEIPSSQGTSEGMCYIYVAFCDKKSAPANDPTELIEVREMSETEFKQRVEQGKWHQWPAIIAWYYYQLRKEGI